MFGLFVRKFSTQGAFYSKQTDLLRQQAITNCKFHIPSIVMSTAFPAWTLFLSHGTPELLFSGAICVASAALNIKFIRETLKDRADPAHQEALKLDPLKPDYEKLATLANAIYSEPSPRKDLIMQAIEAERLAYQGSTGMNS